MEKVKLFWSKTNRWHRAFFFFALVEFRVLPGGQVGFYCNDPALSYPFTGDTISWKLLLATTILLPLAIMLVVERIYNKDKAVKHKQVMCWFREYLFGVLINLVIVQTLKLIVGSPRPHFFDTCSPKEALTCQGSEYVPSYTCTKAAWIAQSSTSFPSGHTSLALHAGLFLVYYLYRRCPPSSKLLIVQALCVFTALFCSVSRMTDHRHHWWDVLAGALIAQPVLYYTINSLCGNFECTNKTTPDHQTTMTSMTSIDTDTDNVPLVKET